MMVLHRLLTTLPLLPVVLVIGLGRVSALHAQDYSALSNSMATFGDAFKHINSSYVDAIDPNVIVDAGVRGMLLELDKYSVLLKGKESDPYDQLSSGTYVGFGYSVVRRNRQLVVTDVRPQLPASNGGLRAGDRLLTVDGIRVDTLSTDSLRRVTDGPEGSNATFRVLRGMSDTLTLVLTRHTIPVQNVGATTVLSNGIAYIELLRFSRRAPAEVSDAIIELQKNGPLRGLVLDLRGNPGGLLEAAIGIANLFLPQGSLIVSTLDRSRQRFDYRAQHPPLDTSLRLVVLLDEESASASEVLAGALQDHDRAVILGRASFGKGLVQSMVQLNDSTSIKLTTSRYYTPSGRCLQRRERRDTSQKDSTTFYTKSGRAVYASQGIIPDSVMVDDSYPPVLRYILRRGVFADFAANTLAGMDALPSAVRTDKKMVERFLQYCSTLPAEDLSAALVAVDTATAKVKQDGLSASSTSALRSARAAIQRDILGQLRERSTIITALLDAEFATCLGSAASGTIRRLPLDRTVQSAQSVLIGSRYAGFLAGGSPGDQ